MTQKDPSPIEELIEQAGGDRIALKTLSYAASWYEYALKKEAEGEYELAKDELAHRLHFIEEELETCAFAMAMRDLYETDMGDFYTPGKLIGEACRIYEAKINELIEIIQEDK